MPWIIAAAKDPGHFVAVTEYQANMERIVAHLLPLTEVRACIPGHSLSGTSRLRVTHSFCQCLVVLSPPPVNTALWPDRSDAAVKEYVAAAQHVAQAHGLPFINVFEAMHKHASPLSEYLIDGLHLNRSVSSCCLQCQEKDTKMLICFSLIPCPFSTLMLACMQVSLPS